MTRILAAAIVAAAVAPGAAPQTPQPEPRDRLVVSAAWLAQHLKDPDLVILHVGQESTYEAGHIPGAGFGDWMALHTMDTKPGALSLEMPPASELHDALAGMGISDTSHVVVYASDEYWSPSTRVVLTLDYAGLRNVSYLDGGLKGWTEAGQPLSKEVPAAKKGALAPLKTRPVIVDADFVKAHIRTPGFAIVDARAASFYDGTQPGGSRGQTRRPGHLPGALSAPFDSFADGDGHLKSNDEIAALFAKAGVKPGDTIIGYCHIGQQATAMLFAARTLGHPVLLYDGSFEDWNARGLPLENPAAGKQEK